MCYCFMLANFPDCILVKNILETSKSIPKVFDVNISILKSKCKVYTVCAFDLNIPKLFNISSKYFVLMITVQVCVCYLYFYYDKTEKYMLVSFRTWFVDPVVFCVSQRSLGVNRNQSS